MIVSIESYSNFIEARTIVDDCVEITSCLRVFKILNFFVEKLETFNKSNVFDELDSRDSFILASRG